MSCGEVVPGIFRSRISRLPRYTLVPARAKPHRSWDLSRHNQFRACTPLLPHGMAADGLGIVENLAGNSHGDRCFSPETPEFMGCIADQLVSITVLTRPSGLSRRPMPRVPLV